MQHVWILQWYQNHIWLTHSLMATIKMNVLNWQCSKGTQLNPSVGWEQRGRQTSTTADPDNNTTASEWVKLVSSSYYYQSDSYQAFWPFWEGTKLWFFNSFPVWANMAYSSSCFNLSFLKAPLCSKNKLLYRLFIACTVLMRGAVRLNATNERTSVA